MPAEVLVVEGWAGRGMMPAVVHKAEAGNCRLVVTVGGSTGDSWAARNWNYAELAAEELLKCGLPKDRLLIAKAPDSESQRTYMAALAVRKALEVRGPLPTAINVWTRGSHARRSRLVFQKVFGSQTRVGVIAWLPEHSRDMPWWRSSERVKDFMQETVGYFFEKVLGSGRWLLGDSR